MARGHLNAQMGFAQPVSWCDVSHLRTCKTFSIPTVVAAPVLARWLVSTWRFLPGDAYRADSEGKRRCTADFARRFGSAGVLPISWMYIATGAQGLSDSSQYGAEHIG